MKTFGLLVLFAYGIFSLYLGYRNAILHSQDLAPVYMASRLWLRGTNPYQPPSLRQWREASPAEAFPVHYSESALCSPYPPVTLLNLSGLSGFRWPIARNIWFAVNLGLVFYIPFMIRRIWYPAWSAFATTLFIAFWMGGIGVRVSLGLGQHGLLAFAFLLAALRRIQIGKPGAGILLALSTHKPNLAIGYLIPLAAKIPRRVFLSAGLALLALYALFFTRVGSHAAEAALGLGGSFFWWCRTWETTYPGTCIHPILYRFLGDPRASWILMNLLRIAGLGGCLWLFRRNRPLPTDIEFGTLSLLSLWMLYHGFQDTFLLIVPITALSHRLRALRASPLRWAVFPLLVFLVGMWFAEASKVYLWLFPSAPAHFSETGLYRAMVDLYRSVIFIAFLGMLLLQGWGAEGFGGRITPSPSERSEGLFS